jgi:MerR family transcriptional regulator, thiopeptide resistance regulator
VSQVEWSIQELARAAGTTSRTLRHYQERSLLHPHRLGAGGMRYYDEGSLLTLLRILVLRELGLGLDAIRDVLDESVDILAALRGHVRELERQHARLGDQIASVQRTIERLEGGERLVAEDVFAGFDHTQYREEVEERWGENAYAQGDRWWRSLSDDARAGFMAEQRNIAAAFGELARAGAAPDSAEVTEVVRRHVEWLRGPTRDVSREYLAGIGELYVADPRFGANYLGYAEFVRDALRAYAEVHL